MAKKSKKSERTGKTSKLEKAKRASNALALVDCALARADDVELPGFEREARIEDVACVRGFIRLCDDAWRLGWHERNGGNLSYRMSAEDVLACVPFFEAVPHPWVPVGEGVGEPDLAGAFFIVTGAGKYLRNVAEAPADNIGIVQVDETGSQMRTVWGLHGGARPTSEFATHFMNHAVRMRASGGADRVIYHAHVPNVIALSYVLEPDDRTFTRTLWKTMTESVMVFPEGLGVLPQMTPGGVDIARATSEKMKTYRAVVWAQHGLFCAGTDFDDAFGLMQTVEKSAQIYRYARQMNGGRDIFRQTISDDALRAIAAAYHVNLHEHFLN